MLVYCIPSGLVISLFVYGAFFRVRGLLKKGILAFFGAKFPISKATETDNEDDDYDDDDDDDDDDDWILLTHIDFKINATALDHYNGRRSGCFSTTLLFSVIAIPNYFCSNREKKTAITNIIPFNNVKNFFIHGIDNPKCDAIKIGHSASNSSSIVFGRRDDSY